VELGYQVLEKGQAPFGAFFSVVAVVRQVVQVRFPIGTLTHLSVGESFLSLIQAIEDFHPHSSLLTGEHRTTGIPADLVDRPGIVGVAVGGTTGILFNRQIGFHCVNRISEVEKRSSPFFGNQSNFCGPHHLTMTVNQVGIQRALGLVTPDGIVDTISDLLQHLPNGIGLAVAILVLGLSGGEGIELNGYFHCGNILQGFFRKSTTIFDYLMTATLDGPLINRKK